MDILAYVLVGLMVLFWGSRVGRHDTRIMLFGLFTLYDSSPVRMGDLEMRWFIGEEVKRQLPPPDEEEEDDEEDGDEDDDDVPQGPSLWDRLEAAGFTVFDEPRDPREAEIGLIDWRYVPEGQRACDRCCQEDAMRLLYEVCRSPSWKEGMIVRAIRNPFGAVCKFCGYCRVYKDQVTLPCGKIAPLMEPGTNFFDVLAYFEKLKREADAAAVLAEGASDDAVSTEDVQTLPAAAPPPEVTIVTAEKTEEQENVQCVPLRPHEIV